MLQVLNLSVQIRHPGAEDFVNFTHCADLFLELASTVIQEFIFYVKVTFHNLYFCSYNATTMQKGNGNGVISRLMKFPAPVDRQARRYSYSTSLNGGESFHQY